MKVYALPESVRDGLIKYLAEQPWKEVHQGMAALLALTPLEQPSAPDEEGQPVSGGNPSA